MTGEPVPAAPPPPPARLSLGVVGHRADNPAFAANRPRIEAVVAEVFDIVAAACEGEAGAVAPRLHSLLADGVDQLAAEMALARGWELVAPLPFGRALNLTINVHPATAAQARALLAGRPCGGPVGRRAEAIRSLADRAHVLELSDGDAAIAALFLAKLDAPEDAAAAERFSVHGSERVAFAGRVMIEQSDIVIGVWDGASRAYVGGTGHTIAAALEMGAPVVWIDARAPEDWRILRSPESLAGAPAETDQRARLAALARSFLWPDEGRDAGEGMRAWAGLQWKPRSNPFFHAYRRVEAVFGGEPSPWRSLRQTYETPDAIGDGGGFGVLAAARALPDADPDFAPRIEADVLRRFAWADGISTRLSDLYRGAMTASFLLSGLAIASGVAYLPIAAPEQKWPFTLVELGLLCGIIGVTAFGQRRGWHARWFETRRVAEYLRHGPVMLALAVSRPPGRWPKGVRTSWPEGYARMSLREVGLPRVALTQDYLRAGLERLLDEHVVRQREYHAAKARRLTRVHHNLDRLSEQLFLLAVVAAGLYLALRAGGAAGVVPDAIPHALSKLFTFLGVLFPTFGAAVAGVRYFGDFERFAAISEVTAEKLGAVHERALLLLAAPEGALDYGAVSDLAHAVDEIVVSEIENWQAVFGGKSITVPA